MQMKIFKYELKPDYLSMQVPVGAKFLHVQEQHGKLYIWALVDVDEVMCDTHIHVYIFATGETIDENTDELEYIGTAMLMQGSLVYHVFVDKEL